MGSSPGGEAFREPHGLRGRVRPRSLAISLSRLRWLLEQLLIVTWRNLGPGAGFGPHGIYHAQSNGFSRGLVRWLNASSLTGGDTGLMQGQRGRIPGQGENGSVLGGLWVPWGQGQLGSSRGCWGSGEQVGGAPANLERGVRCTGGVGVPEGQARASQTADLRKHRDKYLSQASLAQGSQWVWDR